MSEPGGRPGRSRELPYGLTERQLMVLTQLPRRLRDAQEALLLYTPAHEHAIQAGHDAEEVETAFPEIARYWKAVVEEALRERHTRPC